MSPSDREEEQWHNTPSIHSRCPGHPKDTHLIPCLLQISSPRILLINRYLYHTPSFNTISTQQRRRRNPHTTFQIFFAIDPNIPFNFSFFPSFFPAELCPPSPENTPKSLVASPTQPPMCGPPSTPENTTLCSRHFLFAHPSPAPSVAWKTAIVSSPTRTKFPWPGPKGPLPLSSEF